MSWNHWDANGEPVQNVNTSNLVDPQAPTAPTEGFTFGPPRDPATERPHSDGYQSHVEEGYRGSVIGSARDAGGGMIVNRVVSANDRVTLPEGVQTSAAVAANLGYLTRNPDGTFSDIPGAFSDDGEGEYANDGDEDDYDDDDIPDEDGFDIGDEGREALTKIANSVPVGTSVQAMDQILMNGKVSENTLASMASAASVEPGQMMEYINATHQAFHDAASDHLRSLGVVNDEAFASFVQEHPELYSKVTNGARSLVMHSDTEDLTSVAEAFMAKADEYMPNEVMGALDEAGYDYERTASGKLLIDIDGIQVPWEVALKQQLIGFH